MGGVRDDAHRGEHAGGGTARPPATTTVRVGVDIGQVHDPTAIVVTQQLWRDRTEHFSVRSIERLPLGTSYPDVADRIAEVVANLRA